MSLINKDMEYGRRINWSLDTAMEMVDFQQQRIEAMELEIQRLNNLIKMIEDEKEICVPVQ
jgi:hypothetical protein